MTPSCISLENHSIALSQSQCVCMNKKEADFQVVTDLQIVLHSKDLVK